MALADRLRAMHNAFISADAAYARLVAWLEEEAQGADKRAFLTRTRPETELRFELDASVLYRALYHGVHRHWDEIVARAKEDGITAEKVEHESLLFLPSFTFVVPLNAPQQ